MVRSPLGAVSLVAATRVCENKIKQTGRRADDREADEENVGLRVRERPQAIVIFLACRIPQTEVDGLAVHHDVRAVVVEHRGDVLSVGANANKGVKKPRHRWGLEGCLWVCAVAITRSPPNARTTTIACVRVWTNPGNALVVNEMRRHVLPTAPSPTTTHLMVCMVCALSPLSRVSQSEEQ